MIVLLIFACIHTQISHFIKISSTQVATGFVYLVHHCPFPIWDYAKSNHKCSYIPWRPSHARVHTQNWIQYPQEGHSVFLEQPWLKAFMYLSFKSFLVYWRSPCPKQRLTHSEQYLRWKCLRSFHFVLFWGPFGMHWRQEYVIEDFYFNKTVCFKKMNFQEAFFSRGDMAWINWCQKARQLRGRFILFIHDLCCCVLWFSDIFKLTYTVQSKQCCRTNS